jgi:hypothetical protein
MTPASSLKGSDAVATVRSPLEPLDDRLQHRVADRAAEAGRVFAA